MSHGQVGVFNLGWQPSERWCLDENTGGCVTSPTLSSFMSEKWQKLEIIQIPAQGLELYVKVPEVPAGVPRLSSGDLVVIMFLLGKSGRKN